MGPTFDVLTDAGYMMDLWDGDCLGQRTTKCTLKIAMDPVTATARVRTR